MRGFSLSALLAVIILALSSPLNGHAAPTVSPLANWAGFFSSGDFRAHSGAPSEVFDNGRRDVGKAFVVAGLKAENTVHFSVMNRLHASSPEMPEFLNDATLVRQMTRITDKAKGGCLFFYTSHGAPGILIMGDDVLEPSSLNQLLSLTCGSRPTVVIISACYSGSFIADLAAPNRMILTAAREDRSSFGCGEEDTYTFFDGCLLQTLPQVETFDALADKTRDCVAKRETDLKLSPASEPQVSIGDQIKALLPSLKLTPAPPAR